MKKNRNISNLHNKPLRKTKIIATVGPSTNSYESIYDLISNGANGIRLNFSHGDYQERTQQILWIRKAAKEYGRPVAIIQDLQGPKIRLGDFDGEIPVQTGQSLRFKYKSDFERSGIIPTQYDLSKKVKRGERVLLFDGKVRTTVTSVKDGVVHVQADNDGILLKRKGMNLPDTDFAGDVITEKDRRDVVFGSEQDIDYVAMSFVQTPDDVLAMRRILKGLGSKAKIIAKIETVASLEHIEAITDEADAIMIARGDLAVETSPELVPVEQRRIVGVCRYKSTPVIIATQMLATMTDSTEPTRAEVSDVATAAIIGADCVMLSDETANGRYPIEAVRMMKTVVTYAEHNSPVEAIYHRDIRDIEVSSMQASICNAVISLAKEVNAIAIVAETKSGATVLELASRRPKHPLIVVTSQQRVANQLAIVYDARTYIRRDSKLAATKLTDFLLKSDVLQKGDIVVTASGKHPGVVGTTDTIKVRRL